MARPVPRSSLAIVFTVVCIDLLGFGLVLPLLPIYGKELLAGYPGPRIGLILGLLSSSFTLMQFVFAPVWGRISDRVGRRPVLVVGLAGSTAFYGLFGLAALWRSLPLLFAARIGAGIAGATIPTAQAYIADVTPPERRAHGMALIGAAFGLGFTLGPLLGALATWLSLCAGSHAGLSAWPGYVASGLSGVALATAWVLLPESRPARPRGQQPRHFRLVTFRQVLALPSIGLLLAVGFLGVFALANLESSISLVVADKLSSGRPAGAAISSDSAHMLRLFLVFAYVGLIQSLVQGGLVRRLALRLSEGTLAATGMLISILGFTLMALVVDRPECGIGSLMLVVAVEVSGLSFTDPAVRSLLSRRTPPGQQGGILGISEGVSSLARISGIVYGLSLYHIVAALPFWSAAVVMLVALGLVGLAIRAGRDWRGD
jgi:MFS family permease